MTSSSNSRILNTGSFGVVLSPALQNDPPYNNDPHSYVTKIFYNKEDYNDIRKKRKKLTKILGRNNEGYQFQPYEKVWKGKNLPKNAYELLTNSLNNSDKSINSAKNRTFYPIRMLHLGHSIQSVKISPELTSQFRQCEINHVISSIKKLFETLTKLSIHHTIHGDIHSQNILIYMAGTFCEMNLIDYDLFESYDELKDAYQVKGRDYIYGPPEVYHLVLPHKRNISEEKNQEESVIRQYVARMTGSLHFQKTYSSQKVLEEQVRKAIDHHGNALIHYNHIDSFMLCSVLLDLLYYMYPFLLNKNTNSSIWSEQDKEDLNKVKTILESGVTLYSQRRKGPSDIQKDIQRILCKRKGLPSPPSTPRSTINHSQTKTNKRINLNRKNNGCILSGGKNNNRMIRRTKKQRRWVY